RWIQDLGSFSPVKWSILALEGAVWRGYDLTTMLGICAILWGIGAIAFFAGTWIDRRGVDGSG
ncbi:MAG: hypothetical protein KDC38_12040, partial [Planctomycetes bacterium]|nr:hypothetical protein [Planctomycetota bacterium]